MKSDGDTANSEKSSGAAQLKLQKKEEILAKSKASQKAAAAFFQSQLSSIGEGLTAEEPITNFETRRPLQPITSNVTVTSVAPNLMTGRSLQLTTLTAVDQTKSTTALNLSPEIRALPISLPETPMAASYVTGRPMRPLTPTVTSVAPNSTTGRPLQLNTLTAVDHVNSTTALNVSLGIRALPTIRPDTSMAESYVNVQPLQPITPTVTSV